MGSGGSHSLMSSGNSFAAYSSLSTGFCLQKQVAPLRSTPQILNYSMNEVAVLFRRFLAYAIVRLVILTRYNLVYDYLKVDC